MRDSVLGKTLYLDTIVIIFAVEEGNPWAPVLRNLFAAIDDRAVHAFASELTLAEVLAKPLAVGAADLVSKYNQVLAVDSIIGVVPINREILRTSAELQARLGIRLADAIHLATAKQAACDFVRTNDRNLGHKMGTQFKWLSIADLSVPPSSDYR
jgi:predicted nucleic acid-binding protein